MSSKLLWTGLTCIVAVPPFLGFVGLGGGEVFVVIGAVAMVVGAVLLLLDR